MENTEALQDDNPPFIPHESVAAGSRSPSSRFHFPSHDSAVSRHSRRPELAKGSSPLTPPVRRGSPLNPHKVHPTSDPRRRLWPSEAPLVSPESSSRHKRNSSFGFLEPPGRKTTPIPEDELEVGVFSNEYDLSHDDPRILHDIQRALKMKARREARLKRESNTTQEESSPEASPVVLQTPPRKPLTSKFSPLTSFSPTSSHKLSSGTTSDVDFSPSVGVLDAPTQAHPVPLSLDGGTTLDWTGASAEDVDKRWAILSGKRKEKDKLPSLGVIIDQQNQSYRDKLARISGLSSAQTVRKAQITSNQLERQYRLIFDALEFEHDPLNLAKVARWYSSQEPEFRDFIETSEPFTWLKHLDKRDPNHDRSPWHLSALIMEHYHQSFNNQSRTEAKSPTFRKNPHSQSFVSPPRIGTADNFGPSKPGLFADDRISFEPLAEFKPNSFEVSSRKSGDSNLSSLRSGTSNPMISLAPPSTSQTDNRVNPVSVNYIPDASSMNFPDDAAPTNLMIPELLVQAPSDSTNISTTIPLSQATSTESSTSITANQAQNPSPTRQSFSSLKHSLTTRGLQVPSSFFEQRPSSKPALEDKEELLRIEYEEKNRILNKTVAHNHRIRQILNRVSATVREFDSVQTAAMQSLGIVQPTLSRELIEAFGHDPSAVTSSTRKILGWRAIEDIHQRVISQRNTFQEFLDSYQEEPYNLECLLDDPISGLTQALQHLEECKTQIASETKTVMKRLKETQTIHSSVKESYKQGVSTASVAYPQLSHIIALEESYKDQYQQFWDLGMDALTLLLDTVTPVWRTYGKTIGEDVRDFLIIPLYRNEFTGEAKKYPIEQFPRRSLRHWLGLVVFFLVSIGVTILQVRAAITSSLLCRLQIIPYEGVRWTLLPFFWLCILIQWLAVIFEFAVVFMQLSVIAWWIGWSVKIFI